MPKKPDNYDMVNKGALPDKPAPTGPRPGPKTTPTPKNVPPEKKYAAGGMVRGGGAAVKGKKFSRSC